MEDSFCNSVHNALTLDWHDTLPIPFISNLLQETDSNVVVERSWPSARQRLYADTQPQVLYWCVVSGVPFTERVLACPKGDNAYSVDTSHWKVPRRPYYRYLAISLLKWGSSASVPRIQPSLDLLNEVPDTYQYQETLTQELVEILKMWECLEAYQRAKLMREFLNKLGTRAIMTLLGIRRTKGSAMACLPPSPWELLQSFCAPHAPNSNAKLSVGARALSKHCKRSLDGWWGDGHSGEEEVKNNRAIGILARIMEDAAWLNIHALPHDTRIFEIRNTAGYGARWSPDPPLFEFRGFLEPQMEGGHEKGWIH